MIAVIIPYFQREPGILRKALESVFASEGVNDVYVVLVDDESPIPATDELAKIGNTRFPVRLIQQRNAGPGGLGIQGWTICLTRSTTLPFWTRMILGRRSISGTLSLL